ncbi:hypothetical protein L596_012081 [Steinernema carpocapsae]|uniref:TLC domain-containing protein n=1 Tax=Steinernema carpocapsae TaxID=34508 RepID=A0A4U5NW20_STECR|nr:hypothetical protein L596_012081 [Steinernema carpocapsae]
MFQLLGFVVRRYTWNKVQGFRQYRLKNLTVCLVHSSITGCWALSMLLLYPDIMFYHTMHWYQSFAIHLPMISIGYFCYDLTDMLRHEISRWTVELGLHHVASIFVFTSAVLAQKFLPYAHWALLMEINSIFLHLRSIMQLSGEYQTKPKKFMFTKIVNIITFVLCRFAVQVWLIQWCWHHRHLMHSFFVAIGFVVGCFFFVINTILFYRVLASDGLLGEWAKKQTLQIGRDAIQENNDLIGTDSTVSTAEPMSVVKN